MPEPTLSDAPTDNRGLFSDYYLEERFSGRNDVKDLREEAEHAFEEMFSLWQRERAGLEGANEAQTEDRFVQPVLETLGWARQVQTEAEALGKRGRPDYALFTSEKDRSGAVRQHGSDSTGLYSRAAAFGEAKRWGRPLGRGGKETLKEGDPFSEGTPALQVVGYFIASGLDWGILTNGARWRLYYAGSPSQMDTYYEVNLGRVFRLAQGTGEEEEKAQAAFLRFYALFRAGAFEPSPPSGELFVEDVLEASDTFGAKLEGGLEGRIYDDVFLKLARGLYESVEADRGEEAAGEALEDIYQATLRLLYRLLFLLYAEARGLLPIRDEMGYFQYSLTRIAADATEAVEQGQALSRRSSDLWNDLVGLFEIVDRGDPALNVPKYNGGLFQIGEGPNEFLDAQNVSDKRLVPALVALTRQGGSQSSSEDAGGTQVDYKALDVRQLGSIYEGLLEHRLVKTEEGLDLLTDEGERKETGSYYTPHYIVEYIVEETLRPVVEKRTRRFDEVMEELQELETSNGASDRAEELREEAFDALFDMKVCDPAMGSGHFLVQATDYLADRFSDAIGRYPENPVVDRLEEIRGEILEEMECQGVELDELGQSLSDTALLRRVVMKRCIYGVDLNEMAVELAKLSLWLRSFTVGAPLSFLNHHLRDGNSLIGASVEEVRGELAAGGGSQGGLFDGPFSKLEEVTELMRGVARQADATLEEVEASADGFDRYEEAAEPYKQALDVWTSRAFGNRQAESFLQNQGSRALKVFRGDAEPKGEAQEEVIEKAHQVRREHSPFHWELEFPEVYFDLEALARKDNPGFDAVIGNPPYVRIQSLRKTNERVADYYSEVFSEATGNFDVYVLFAAEGYKRLREEGRLGFILSNKFFRLEFGRGLRRVLSADRAVDSVVDLNGNQIFPGQTTYTCLLFLSGASREQFEYVRFPRSSTPESKVPEWLFEASPVEPAEFNIEQFSEDPWLLATEEERPILDKIRKQSVSLKETAESVIVGLQTSADKIYAVEHRGWKDDLRKVYSSADEMELLLEDEPLKPLVSGSHAGRYICSNTDELLIFPYHLRDDHADLIEPEDFEANYPHIWGYLKSHEEKLRGRESEKMDHEEWYAYGRNQNLHKQEQVKLCVPRLVEQLSFFADEDGEKYLDNVDVNGVLPNQESGVWYLLSLLNSRLLDWRFRLGSVPFRGGYLSANKQFISGLPIREVESTTSKEERERYVADLIDLVEVACPEVDPADNSVLDSVDDHLSAEPERFDVARDLLSHMAREMTRLKGERHEYNLDITDYAPEPSEENGIVLTDIGRYQAASGVTDSILAETTECCEKLRIGRLLTSVEGEEVTVQATARYKPEGDVPESELDSYGYYETDPIDFCLLDDCSDEEQKLVRHWLDALNEKGGGFAGFREGAGKTISLRGRLLDLRLPNLEQRSRELKPFFWNAEEAARLDRQIEFTDDLIDQVVYRLYGLTDEEVAVVEG